MQLSSTAFTHGGKIPKHFTCEDEGLNPPLNIRGVPVGTRCLALIMDDPDSPSGTFVHWTLWNIPYNTTEIEAGSIPKGVIEGQTSKGRSGYVGPCPHEGTHHYSFRLYALSTSVELLPSATVSELSQAMNGHILTQTELVGFYCRESE